MLEFEAIEWDENKRLKNIEKHGLDFYDAIFVLSARQLGSYHLASEGTKK